MGDPAPRLLSEIILAAAAASTGSERQRWEIVFAKSISPYASNHPKDSLATIFIHLRPSILDGILKRIGLSEERSLSIINGRNELLYTTDRHAAYPGIQYESLSAEQRPKSRVVETR